jgi:hypothetical protein
MAMGIGMSCCCTKERQVCHACFTTPRKNKLHSDGQSVLTDCQKNTVLGEKEKRHHRKYN